MPQAQSEASKSKSLALYQSVLREELVRELVFLLDVASGRQKAKDNFKDKLLGAIKGLFKVLPLPGTDAFAELTDMIVTCALAAKQFEVIHEPSAQAAERLIVDVEEGLNQVSANDDATMAGQASIAANPISCSKEDAKSA